MTNPLPDDEEQRGRTFRQKENLNRFGRWVEALNLILGTNQTDIAKRAGMEKNTISTATRNPDGPSREVLRALGNAYEALSKERGIVLPVVWKYFFYLTWIGESINGEDQKLEALESWANVVKELRQSQREVEALKREMERLERRVVAQENRQLKVENEMLKREIRRLREMREGS